MKVPPLHPVAVRAATVLLAALGVAQAGPGPFDGKTFKGRIAWSCDGNHNDEDDWAASPIALAIFAASGVQDRLVHFDYNNILPQTNPDWERQHEISISGAVARYGYKRSLFHDCQRDLDAAVNSIAAAVNASSAEDPLYFVLAGPMQVPFLGIQKSDPAKRKFVYCISHSRWNDGFAARYTFPYNKRALIRSGIRWIQIADQNKWLATSPFGRPATDLEWTPWLWMRDSSVASVRFLWERMLATTRADCSDAGMAYFLVTGDEAGDIDKLRQLLEKQHRPVPIDPRSAVRIEAENFFALGGYELEDGDRQASHRLSVRLAEGVQKGEIRTPFDEPYTASRGLYDVEIRHSDGAAGRCRYSLLVNGVLRGEAWDGEGGADWRSHHVADVAVKTGDEISVQTECRGGLGRLDYLQLTLKQ